MIEHLKSGLSISTHIGCTMGCNYCVLSVVGGFTDGPKQDSFPEETIEALLSDTSLFLDSKTALFINNRTDPMLPSVEKSTLRLLELLVNNHINSPVLLITKFPPTKEITPLFDNLHLMYVYSYSGYKNDFNYNRLEYDTKQICKHTPKASRFHYLRPIIPNANDNIEDIRQIINHFDNAEFAGSILAGFRVNKHNTSLLPHKVEYSTQHKLFSTEIYQTLVDDGAKDYGVFRHTSCAICYYMHTFNKLNYFNRKGHCSINCPNHNVCASKPNVTESDVKTIMKRCLPEIKNWYYENELLIILDEVNQEHIAFVKNALGIKVKAEKVCLSASERIITNEK